MNNTTNLIVGLGLTGQSIGHWLAAQGESFVFFDTRQAPPLKNNIESLFPRSAVYCADLPESLWSTISAVYVSPGVALSSAVIQRARQAQLPLLNDIDCLALALPKACMIAITGTNGKSTVTELVGLMAKEDNLPCVVAGNIGQPVLTQLQTAPDNALWVLELSSFQLDLCQHLRPTAATILNVSPDHLDRHGTFNEYVAAKRRIYQHAQWAVYNRGDESTLPTRSIEASSFGQDEPQVGQWGIRLVEGVAHLCFGEDLILSTETLKLKGRHFWQNALAAAALGTHLGVSMSAIKRVLSRYTGLPYRTQWVINKNQIDYINDSKGTNVGATQSAIMGIAPTIKGKLILIAGGQGKGADFSALAPCVAEYVKSVVVFGEDRALIAHALRASTALTETQTLTEALTLAVSQAQCGDCILFSPACASFDQFRDFNHRGEVFNQLVEALA